ncbi:hypothetical protein [Bythopirellula goksoeyrii]|nr:hypothetical protein [Bythopirellula goksoeyrii]
MNPTEFHSFVKSLNLDKNVDAIADFSTAFRSDLLEEQKAWTTYRLKIHGGGFRFQIDDDELPPQSQYIRRSTRVEPGDLRYVPQYLFTTESTSVLYKQDCVELTFDGKRNYRQLLVDPKNGFVFNSFFESKVKKNVGKKTHEVVIQRSPKEYHRGVIWPSVFVKGEFRDGTLFEYTAYVVEESISDGY